MKGHFEFSFDAFREVIEQFASCMNDYLYVVDVKNDVYYIADRALERFALPGAEFTNVTETHRQFVYKDDFPMLQEDLNRLLSGEKDSHDIVYRWIGLDGQPIWINCKGKAIHDAEGNTIFMVGCINEVGKRNIADNVSGLLGDDNIWDEWAKFEESFKPMVEEGTAKLTRSNTQIAGRDAIKVVIEINNDGATSYLEIYNIEDKGGRMTFRCSCDYTEKGYDFKAILDTIEYRY